MADALRSCALSFECPVGWLEKPSGEVHVRRRGHGDLAIRTFWRGAHGFVSLPPCDELGITVDSSDIDELLGATRRGMVAGTILELADGMQLAVGEDPVTMSIADAASLPTRASAAAALIHDPSAFVLDELRNLVSPAEWRSGGGDLRGARRVGALSGGALVAIATVEQSVGHLARVRAIVAPTHRRRGFGQTVLLELSRRVTREGNLPYARLAADQAASANLAGITGFVPFARSLTLSVVSGAAQWVGTSTKP